ncbi:hypothetical protein J6X15_02900 [Candidatus Saccharibacteria bacterium]|nr:hypothetical protein [Candidatus Saccharibacteria bacterium]
MRILIAVPTFENITPDTFKSIYELKRGDFETEFTFVRGYDCAKARNKIAEEAIKRKVDYVFMVDSDITLPKTALIHLLEHYPEVCYGYCVRHKAIREHDETAVNKIGKSSSNAFTTKELSDKRKKKIYRIPIRSAGAACALIKTSVFDSIDYPWFDYVSYKNKTFLSEDYYFCQQCRKAGIIMLVDTRVACGHRFTYFRSAESGN